MQSLKKSHYLDRKCLYSYVLNAKATTIATRKLEGLIENESQHPFIFFLET